MRMASSDYKRCLLVSQYATFRCSKGGVLELKRYIIWTLFVSLVSKKFLHFLDIYYQTHVLMYLGFQFACCEIDILQMNVYLVKYKMIKWNLYLY